MSSEAIAMLTLATTAGGFATAIYSLGFVLLGYSLYQSKLIHVISSYALMLAGVIGLLGGILFYDEGLIIAYYYHLHNYFRCNRYRTYKNRKRLITFISRAENFFQPLKFHNDIYKEKQ